MLDGRPPGIIFPLKTDNKKLTIKKYQKTNKPKSLNLTNPDPAGIDPWP